VNMLHFRSPSAKVTKTAEFHKGGETNTA
jgi:hypothetical protein